MDNGSETNSILNLTQKLLDSIAVKDWEVYISLVDEKLIAVENESENNFIEGLDFHKFYFDLPRDNNLIIKENIVTPNIKILGDVAIICYKRIRQTFSRIDNNIKSETSTETRIWRNFINIGWKLIHFHRS